MKLTIEINDHTLHAAIEAQLQKVVAGITDTLIATKVNEIVDKKLARVSDSDLQMAMTSAAEAQLDRVLGSRQGNTWERDRKLKAFITDAAVAAIKSAKP